MSCSDAGENGNDERQGFGDVFHVIADRCGGNRQQTHLQWVFYRTVFLIRVGGEISSVSDHLAAAKFLGERLRELRARHELTQEQASALCGMEYKYYQMVEWGRKNLRLDTIARIASAYQLGVWDLVQSDGLPPSRIKKLPGVVAAPHRPPRPRGRPPKSV